MKRLLILAAVLCLAAQAADNAAFVPQPAVSPKPQLGEIGADAITIPQILSYQGRLTDTFGLPVADTTYGVEFRLYSQPTGGSPFWNEARTVRTQDGLFSVLLGSVTPIGLVPDAGAAYLAMAISGGGELTPRLRIASAAYAYLSARAADADLLQGKDTTGLVRAGQANSVTSAMIVNGTIAAVDLGQMGASSGQVMKWTGSAWAPRNDSVGGGGGGGTVTSVSQGTGVTCTPDPITTAGTVALNTGYADGRYVNVTGDSMTGTLAIGAPLRVRDKAALGYSCYNNGFAAFCAGYGNSAGGDRASITGGEDNSASGKYSHVGGGSENVSSGLWTTIGGGNVNEVTDSAGTIAGGRENWATAPYATVGGGQNNTASSRGATVAGGIANAADSSYATVAGGHSNAASHSGAAVLGGFGNDATGAYSFIGGGQNNDASGSCAAMGGGQYNNSAEFCAVVGGGQDNNASGVFSVVPGGRYNRARGYLSFAAGIRAHANHHACFVWGDSTQSLSDSVYTTGSNQWHVRARGGVWFYSNLARTRGVYLAPNASSWSGISYEQDGSAVPVDRHDLLERLATVPVREYRLEGQDESVRHIGPRAHEYRKALGYGETENGINMADADGVALAAIQALYERVEMQQAEIEALKAELKRR